MTTLWRLYTPFIPFFDIADISRRIRSHKLPHVLSSIYQPKRVPMEQRCVHQVTELELLKMCLLLIFTVTYTWDLPLSTRKGGATNGRKGASQVLPLQKEMLKVVCVCGGGGGGGEGDKAFQGSFAGPSKIFFPYCRGRKKCLSL